MKAIFGLLVLVPALAFAAEENVMRPEGDRQVLCKGEGWLSRDFLKLEMVKNKDLKVVYRVTHFKGDELSKTDPIDCHIQRSSPEVIKHVCKGIINEAETTITFLENRKTRKGPMRVESSVPVRKGSAERAQNTVDLVSCSKKPSVLVNIFESVGSYEDAEASLNGARPAPADGGGVAQ